MMSLTRRSRHNKFSTVTKILCAVSSSSFFRASAGFSAAGGHHRPLFGRIVSSHPKKQLPHRMTSSDNDNIAAPTEKTPTKQHSELELEKKFPVPENPLEFRNLKETLTSVGFQITHEEEFVDWYFDLPGPNWNFSLEDIWIRYREKKWKMDRNTWGWRGGWQVKRGEGTADGGSTKELDGMTIYREYHGVTAKDMILEMLSSLENDNRSQGLAESQVTLPSLKFYDGQDIPHLDGAEELVPFAMFKTFRTCWEIPSSDGGNKFSGLKVDIDRTDFGFAVGEVEAVFPLGCNDETTVESGKENIRVLVELLTPAQNTKHAGEEKGSIGRTMPMGKLENYLINNNKYHYEACRRAGVM